MNTIREKYIKNVKKPQSGILGNAQLKSMNKRHNLLALWGLSHIDLSNSARILDVGCGGGKNIENMLTFAPNAEVWGLDYSSESVAVSKKLNAAAIKNGRTQVFEASVEDMPFENESFDAVTAFETVYFWNIDAAFKEIARVLKKGGQLLIVNEARSSEGSEELMNLIGFNVYTAERLAAALKKSGFTDAEIFNHQNGRWITVKAKKA